MEQPAFSKLDLGDLERYRVRSGGKGATLADIPASDDKGFPFDKKEAQAATADDVAAIDRLQDILYAEGRRSILIILQGMDASGKDGTIRKVFGPIDPLGITTSNFKKPAGDELAHDYLWRIHKAVPPARMIGIFNRSHYEDVVTVRVLGLVPPERIEQRYQQINDFERHLAWNDVTILKFFLHISKDEQKKRLQERLDIPEKRWKFSPDDLAARSRWDSFAAAYETALDRCSTRWAPWFIVPADRKWYRNAVIAHIVRMTLEAMDLSYPAEMPGLDRMRIE